MRGCAICLLLCALLPALRAADLTQEAFVWHRSWDAALVSSIQSAPTSLSRVVVLVAEAAWRDRQLRVARVTPDYVALRQSRMSVGLAVRIGAFPLTDTSTATRLSEFVAGALSEARAQQLVPAEIQIDFDCPEAGLDAYRAWLHDLRPRLGTVPLTVTTLPCWLQHEQAFRRLASECDGFVLQVHSLESQRDGTTAICHTNAACRAVAAAATFGRPFRIALPTYGYVAGFDQQGHLVGCAAEGPSLTWPEGTAMREIRTDPAAMASLVHAWTASPPRHCTGIIWYRLPCVSDRLNWSWPTLRAVMQGRAPQATLVAEVRTDPKELLDLTLVNRGDADASGPVAVTVRWHDARQVLACDALGGMEQRMLSTNAVRFAGNPRVEPGKRCAIGWIRFRQTEETVPEITIE